MRARRARVASPPLPHHVLRPADDALGDPASQPVTGERGHVRPVVFISPLLTSTPALLHPCSPAPLHPCPGLTLSRRALRS